MLLKVVPTTSTCRRLAAAKTAFIEKRVLGTLFFYLGNSVRRLPTLLLVLAIVLPLFSWLHYSPLPDWWTDTTCMVLIALAWLGCLLLPQAEAAPAGFPLVLVLALGWLVVAILLPAGSHQGGLLLAMKASGFLVMAFAGGGLAYSEAQRHGRQQFLVLLAWGLLLAALAQAALGLLQMFGFASLGQGYVFYYPNQPGSMVPFGNIAQRNLFAHFLGWGMLAGCYLVACKRLHGTIGLPALAFLSLLMAWSGSRLVLAYAGGFVLLAGLWWLRARLDQTVQRFALTLIAATLLIMLAQLFNHELVGLIRSSGADIQVVSGADRLLDAGFGARRRIEWSKAWQVLQAHPLFGAGFGSYAWQSTWYEAYGGYPKVVESALFTHSHSLIFQLMAETGWIGLLGASAILLYCLLPYLHKQEATPDNLLLSGIVMITLGHSLFEYPLWYMPFLTCFAIVLSLAPGRALQITIRPLLRNVLVLSISLGAIVYGVTGVPMFWRLVYWQVPSGMADEDNARMRQLIPYRQNPLWATDVDLVLSNYLVPSRQQLPTQLMLFSEMAHYRPYFEVLVKLAMLEALDQQPGKAQATMSMALAAFPDLAGKANLMLSNSTEPEYIPLKSMVDRALAAFRQGGATAAASAVSKAEYRQSLF